MKKVIVILLTIVSIVSLFVLAACGGGGDNHSSGGSSSGGKQSGPFTVTFDVCGGNEIETQSVKKGEKAFRPDDPVREGNEFTDYKFLGWYLGETLYDFDSAVNGNFTLTAKWEEVVWSEDISGRN